MRRLFVLLLTLVSIASPGLADPVHGLWKTKPDDNGHYGHVRVQTCANGKICGGLVTAFDPTGARVETDMIGRAIVWDMVPQGNGAYADGRVYAPDRDSTYNARMSLRGNTLGVSGCVAFICRESEWTRVQ
ncbi:MAG: DUF2147 domain-containing protein [Rhodobacteraceae bacterium]|nr:MAG: DUF2147 domain-containing protein [Paracoccaceae bacterium]